MLRNSSQEWLLSLWQYTETTLKIKQEKELELQMAQTLFSRRHQYSCFFLPHNQPKYVYVTKTPH